MTNAEHWCRCSESMAIAVPGQHLFECFYYTPPPMTTNTDHQTPYEHETTSALIAGTRRLADLKLLVGVDRLLLHRTADALEAAEASRERLFLEHRDYVELVKSLKDYIVATKEQVQGLREIVTSGPSTASEPSPLSHKAAKTRLANIEAAAQIFFASDSWCYARQDHDDSAITCPCGYAQLRAAFGPAAPMEDAP